METPNVKSVAVCCRLADGAVDHPGCSSAHHALLHMLLSVLPTEVLLLRPLPLLSADVLLPRERSLTPLYVIHQDISSCSYLKVYLNVRMNFRAYYFSCDAAQNAEGSSEGNGSLDEWPAHLCSY